MKFHISPGFELDTYGLRTDVYGKKFSASNMAKFCGVTRQTIYNVFEGKTVPNIYLAKKICQYISYTINIRVTIEDLFIFDEVE